MREFLRTRTSPARALAALALLLFALHAQAQLVDELELRKEGEDAVLQVNFVTPVQFLRSVSARSGDLGQVYYDVLPTRDTLSLQTFERRVPAGAAAPLLVLTDEAAGGPERSRRLVLRFVGNTAFVARAGQGGRSIELVLRGKGDAVTEAERTVKSRTTPASPAKAPAAAAVAPTVLLVLESSEREDEIGAAVIPAMLQTYVVARRAVQLGGKTWYQTTVTGFKSRAEAQALLAPLRSRFPEIRLDEELPSPAAPPAGLASPAGPVATRPAAAPPPASTAAAPAGKIADASAADERAAVLMASARRAMEQGEHQQAIVALDELLGLPPNRYTQDAQEQIAQARWRQGDPERARAEFELYLRLYPEGAGVARVKEALLTLAPPPLETQQASAKPAVTAVLSGSVSSFYYGGQSKIRTQEFQDSPLSGLPELISDATLSNVDQKQLISSIDLNWRRRDADSDLRLVLRDTYSADLLRSAKSKNKLSALYADYRLTSQGINLRLGRQSPTGGGVMGRFDGVQAGYRFLPKYRISAVAGQPTDSLLNSKRYFYGAALEADAIAKGVGGSVYLIEQRIDGEIDRRGVGSELRLLAGNLQASALLDYDTTMRGLNIASLQGTWVSEGNTVINALYDRRSTPMLMLGNSLFFQNPVLALQATRLQELLASQSLAMLREQVRGTTAYSTQAMVGFTRPISANMQVGADVRLTNVGALLPVPDILPNGQPGTGNIWSTGLQLIGTNLYSARDTHVLVLTLLKGPTYEGKLISYNNSSSVGGGWQLEPSVRVYIQDDKLGMHSLRWAPGLRVTYRMTAKLAIESELSTEFSSVDGPSRNESSNRTFWYFGLRYEL